MGTTTRGAFPYPDAADNSKLVRSQLQALADRAAAASTLFAEGTAAARPAASTANRGTLYHATDTGVVSLSSGTAWSTVKLGATTIRVPHTFTISGEVKVAVGDDFYIPPFFVPVPAGQTVTMVAGQRGRARINSGTSADFDLRQNGVAIAGSATSATTAGVTIGGGAANVTFADGDRLALVVTAVSGTPKNLTVSVYLDYQVS